MKTLSKIFSILLLTSLFASCNNEVFVEPLPELEDEIFLNGDGGTYSFKVQKKNLQDIKLDNSFDTRACTAFYDKDDELIEVVDKIEDVAKIMYFSERFALEFLINGEEITATALDNTYSADLNVWAGIVYKHVTQYITFHISPGKPLEITYLGYDTLNPVTGQKTEREIPHHYTNNSSQPQRILIYPYKDHTSRIDFIPLPGMEWVQGAEGNISVPFWNGNRWIKNDTNKVEITLGNTAHFNAVNTPVDDVAVIDIPAYSTVTSILSVTYATLNVTYAADTTQPNSGIITTSMGTCTLLQPISYQLDVTIDDY